MRTPDSTKRGHRSAGGRGAPGTATLTPSRVYEPYISEDDEAVDDDDDPSLNVPYEYVTYADAMATTGGGMADAGRKRGSLRGMVQATAGTVSRWVLQPMIIGAAAAFGMSVGYAAFDYAAGLSIFGLAKRTRVG